jgi:hypothetical protein
MLTAVCASIRQSSTPDFGTPQVGSLANDKDSEVLSHREAA